MVCILRPITPETTEVTVIGENADAPYGLTNLISSNYGRLDPTTGVLTFSSDPTAFGLEGLPVLSDRLFGSSDDSLFGFSSGTAVIDFQNQTGLGSGTINITSGSGRFSGATGTLLFTEEDTLSPDPTVPARGQAFVRGSFQTVPESKTNTAIVGLGMIAVSFLLRQHSRKSAFVSDR